MTTRSVYLAEGRLEVAAATAIGRREDNQDAWLVSQSQNLLAVADGIGGLRGGGEAARIACETLDDSVSRGHFLDEAIQQANEAVRRRATELGYGEGMGTTLAAVRWDGELLRLVWLGDSVVMTFSSKDARALTLDHSMVAPLVAAGELTAEQARVHPQRNVITQALGVTTANKLRPGLNYGGLAMGERLLLATDGVFEKLTPADVHQVLMAHDDAADCVTSLIDAAESSGTRDNMTAIVGIWRGPEREVRSSPTEFTLTR